MRLLLIGPPGAGKGTQATRISQTWGVPHVSTGNMLREAIAAGTPLGRRVQEVVDSGGYVSDETMIDLVRETLGKLDGFLLDGFPRTPAQADALDDMLGAPLDAVIYLDVPDEQLVERLSRRRTCPTCQRAYHIDSNPPKVAGRCDEDSTELVAREDDEPETVRYRLKVYHEQTDPLVARYKKSGNLLRVDGTDSVDDVGGAIDRALKGLS